MSMDLALVEIITGVVVSVFLLKIYFGNLDRYKKDDDSIIYKIFMGLFVVFISFIIFINLKIIEYSGELLTLVRGRSDESGSISDVTGVLLNFRAYDTLLEIAVITVLVYLLNLWQGDYRYRGSDLLDLVTKLYLNFLIIFMVLIGYFVLISGTKSFDGAFQAGLLFAIVFYLITLLNGKFQIGRYSILGLLGFSSFIFVGGYSLLVNGNFMKYRAGEAYILINLVEHFIALSIGFIFYKSFVYILSDEND